MLRRIAAAVFGDTWRTLAGDALSLARRLSEENGRLMDALDAIADLSHDTGDGEHRQPPVVAEINRIAEAALPDPDRLQGVSMQKKTPLERLDPAGGKTGDPKRSRDAMIEQLRAPNRWQAEYVSLESRSYETHETDLPKRAAERIGQLEAMIDEYASLTGFRLRPWTPEEMRALDEAPTRFRTDPVPNRNTEEG